VKRGEIGVDIDEVLFPFVDEFLKDYNPRYQTDHQVHHFITCRFEEVLGLELEETIRRVYDFNAMDCLHITPVQDSVSAIKELSEAYELNVITARHPQHEKPIRNWLESHYGDAFKNIIFVGHPDAVEQVKPKSQICREIGALALIDDSLDHILQTAQDGLQGVLFGDYPWNQADELPKGVTRVKNWQEVLEYFDGRG
jgi:5'(3')-deoxyribonucleotidase